VCVCVCVCVYVCICIYTCTHVIYTCVCICICMYIYIYIYTIPCTRRCLHYSEEKVSSAQNSLDMIQQRLKQLDDDIAGIDEFMLSQPQQVSKGAEEGSYLDWCITQL